MPFRLESGSESKVWTRTWGGTGISLENPGEHVTLVVERCDEENVAILN